MPIKKGARLTPLGGGPAAGVRREDAWPILHAKGRGREESGGAGL